MRSLRAVILIPFLGLAFPALSEADGILISWAPNTLQGMTEERWEAAKKQSADDVLKAISRAETWPDAYLCLLGANAHKDDKKFLGDLAAHLTDQSERTLKNTSRLVIWERISTGEILFEGKGFQVEDDLFTVAGRANWILRTIAKKNFGYVKPKQSKESLQILQDRWNHWIAGEEVQEYSDPYPSTQKGLDEIRSLAAIEALVISIQPNKEKDKVTSECLRTIYHLDKLPTEPGAQARLCNPDTYAYSYLAKITDVTEEHDPTWWSKWWEQSKARLRWDHDTTKFVVKRENAQLNQGLISAAAIVVTGADFVRTLARRG